MHRKKIAAVATLLCLLGTPASAAPLAENLAGLLDSLLELPLRLAGLSTENSTETGLQLVEPVSLPPSPLEQGEEEESDGTTEKGPKIDIGG